MKTRGTTGFDIYRCLLDTPEYPRICMVSHRESLRSWKEATDTPEMKSVQSELSSWQKRGVMESTWSSVYQLIKSFRIGQSSEEKPDTRIENAPIMHLEAYDLTMDNQETYAEWYSEYGLKVFVPLFMNIPGIKGYDWYKYTGLQRSTEIRDHDYPPYLSIIYFDNLDSFEKFKKSQEQRAYQKALRMTFPLGIRYEWYVQYELTNSQRR